MPEPGAEKMQFPGSEMPPINTDKKKMGDIEKTKRLVGMPDGTVELVDSIEDEIKKKKERIDA